MPLYEYECQQCHRRVEKIQKFSDGPLTVCPHCSGTLERTLTAPAIQFKGSGWYKDLYSSAKPAAPAAGEAKPAASGEGSSSAEGKPVAPASAPAAPASSTPAPSSSSTGS